MAGITPRRFPSPLRYPGGKGKVANFIRLLFLDNDLVGHHYVEPYAGGASVALSLLYEEYASHIHINDLDRSIFALWDAVLHRTEALCRRIVDTPITMGQWERQRAVQAAEDPEPLDLAFSTLFLNRTNRSGIISGGVIGGRDQSGQWKLDARFNKADLVRRIKKAARYRTRITITRLDAALYIRKVLPDLPLTSLVYLDPPYYTKGEGLYENFYCHEDHVGIAALVRKIRQPWVVSYDAEPEITALYTDFQRIDYKLSYSAADRCRGAEVMFFSRGLLPPEVASPANIRIGVVDRRRRLMVS